MKVENHIFAGRTLESNLVYPLDQGYVYVAKLDKDWVKQQLRMIDRNIIDIGNKYCVEIKSNIGTHLITNHDGSYFLTRKSKFKFKK